MKQSQLTFLTSVADGLHSITSYPTNRHAAIYAITIVNGANKRQHTNWTFTFVNNVSGFTSYVRNTESSKLNRTTSRRREKIDRIVSHGIIYVQGVEKQLKNDRGTTHSKAASKHFTLSQ